MVGVMKTMATSFKRICACTIVFSAPGPAHGPLPTHASPRDSWTLTGKSGSVSYWDTVSFSWLLVHTRGFVCALQESVSPDLWKFCNQIPLASKVKFPGGSHSLCQIPKLGNLLWVLELS